MTKSTKKESERSFLRCFIELSGVVPAGEVRESERPDFLFTSDRGTTGVEVTEVFQAQATVERPMQAHEGDSDWIVHRAREICENQGTPPANVSVSFAGSRIPDRRRRHEAASSLAAIVRENMWPLHRPRRLVNRWPILELPGFLHSVTIVRLNDNSSHIWNCATAGFVKEDCSLELQAAIDAKSPNLQEYQLTCDECWLLLATDGRRPSSSLEPDSTTAKHIYNSPFKRTFFLNTSAGQWIDLRTVSGSLPNNE